MTNQQKLSRIREDLDKYFVFRQCQFELRAKGLFVHCPAKVADEICRYRHIVIGAAMKHGISGFVIFLNDGERYAGTKITPENLWELRRCFLEMMYRNENYFQK